MGGHGAFTAIKRHSVRAWLEWVSKLSLLELLQGDTAVKEEGQIGEIPGRLPQFQPKHLSFNLFSTLGFHLISYLRKRKCSIDKNKNLKQLHQSKDRLPGKDKLEIRLEKLG